MKQLVHVNQGIPFSQFSELPKKNSFRWMTTQQQQQQLCVDKLDNWTINNCWSYTIRDQQIVISIRAKTFFRSGKWLRVDIPGNRIWNKDNITPYKSRREHKRFSPSLFHQVGERWKIQHNVNLRVPNTSIIHFLKFYCRLTYLKFTVQFFFNSNSLKINEEKIWVESIGGALFGIHRAE